MRPTKEDDWFKEAADEAASTPQAKRVAEAREKIIKTALTSSLPGDAAAAAEALREFAAVASGAMPSYTPGMLPSPYRTRTRAPSYTPVGGHQGGGPKVAPVERVTAKRGLEAILKEVRESPDPFIAAGQWISTITNELSKIANEASPE